MARKAREGWPIPNVIDPPETMSVTLCVPKNRDHLATFFGALHELTMWNNWTPDAEHSGKELGAVWLRYWYSWDRQLNDIECEDGMSKCCTPNPEIKRFDPSTGRPQISYDNGSTWQSDPSDTQGQIQVLPPIVHSGSTSTKCDAATNASQHINELITATGENLSTASDVFELALAIAEAALALFLIIISAGSLTAPVTAVATAIWAAATALFNLGIDAYNAYWTTDKQDAILCQLYCNIGENGQFTEAQYQAFRAGVTGQLPASPALDIVMTTINAGGARGLSQMASYGNAALADCSACTDCTTCIDGWVWPTASFGANATVVKDTENNWITAEALGFGGFYYWGFQGNACCAMQVTVTAGDNPNAFKGLIPCPEPETWSFYDESSPPWTAAGLTLNGNAFAVLMRSTTPFTARIEFI